MKTAISVPDETFNRVSERAAELGWSRSEFFSKAAEKYVEHLDAASVTAQIDHAVTLAGADDSASAAVIAGRRHLALDDEW